jgi:hypothetical protein
MQWTIYQMVVSTRSARDMLKMNEKQRVQVVSAYQMVCGRWRGDKMILGEIVIAYMRMHPDAEVHHLVRFADDMGRSPLINRPPD